MTDILTRARNTLTAEGFAAVQAAALDDVTSVWYVDWFDADKDDRRGGFESCADDYGVWLTEAGAAAKALELNQKDADKQRAGLTAGYARRQKQWEQSVQEFDALERAGLRDIEDRPKPPPSLEDLLTAQTHYHAGIVVDGVRLTNYYGVCSLDVNQ